MFVLAFNNGHDNPTRNSFDKYSMPLVEIKYFITLINKKTIFWSPIKNQTYEKSFVKSIEMSKNDYTSGNLLYFSYHQKYYKLIGLDLLRQTNTSIPRQINFTSKLEDLILQ